MAGGNRRQGKWAGWLGLWLALGLLSLGLFAMAPVQATESTAKEGIDYPLASIEGSIDVVFTPGVHGNFVILGAGSGNRKVELPILRGRAGLLRVGDIPLIRSDRNWRFIGWSIERVASQTEQAPKAQPARAPQPPQAEDTAPQAPIQEEEERFSFYWYDGRLVFPLRHYDEPIEGKVYRSEVLLSLRLPWVPGETYRITARYRHLPQGKQGLDAESDAMAPIPRVGEEGPAVWGFVGFLGLCGLGLGLGLRYARPSHSSEYN